MSNLYKQAGVDIEAGYEAVSRMQKHVKQTMRPEVLSGLGGFGGMFDLSKFTVAMKEPVLVSGTDGVGTKLMLAFMMDKHDTIGIDAVAMCVNDILVQGAEPLYFLDYIACGKADVLRIEQIVAGVAKGCQEAGCALIGGETAEMPGMYQEDEYDLAGFAVGIVDKHNIISGDQIQVGDVLIGLASSGLHSNGYSLVRKILLTDAKLDLHQQYGDLSCTLGEELLRPTRIYVQSMLSVLKEVQVKGMAHITGGGFIENIPRMLPDGIGVEIFQDRLPIVPIFELLAETGNLDRAEMFSIFNMGIGLVVAVDQANVARVLELLAELGEEAYVIGQTVHGTGVRMIGGTRS